MDGFQTRKRQQHETRPIGGRSVNIQGQVFKRDGPGCYLCPTQAVRAYRIDPESGNSLDNLIALCEPCRRYVENGNTHRTERMATHRWVNILRKFTEAGRIRRQAKVFDL